MQFSRLSLVAKGLLVLAFAHDATAFWRMPCLSRSGLARMDPLVTPGKVTGHVHAIHGSSGFSTTSGTPELVAGECTSCQVAEDKSAYWSPALYFKHAATGEFELVEQVGGMLAYYLLYPNSGDTTVNAFPQGFSMIAGDTFQRNFTYPVPDIPKSNWNVAPYNTQAFLRQAAVGFNCLNYSSPPEATLYRHSLPDKAFLDATCKDGVRFELMFPSCWNGSTTSTDHKSHVAYPSEVMTGDCPPEYPKRLVSLLFETIWNTHEFVGVDGEFVLANGDPTGYGYHGDFIMGWDEDVLDNAVETCTNASGEITDCPLFTIQDSSVYSSCNFTEPAAAALDNILSPVGSLPGSIAINSGPAYAAATSSSVETSTAPVLSVPSVESSLAPAPTTSKLPGVVFAAVSAEVDSTTTPSTTTVATPTTTVAPPPPPPTSSVSYYSTQYVTSGQVVDEILWLEDVVTVTEAVTSTVSVQGAQDIQARDHLHKHRHINHHH